MILIKNKTENLKRKQEAIYSYTAYQEVNMSKR